MDNELPPRCATRFTPVHVISSGGQGTVWMAREVQFDRRVALEVLHPEVLHEPASVARFLQEARITASMAHPHIVKVIDHDVEDGVPWIAYEYVDGPSLATVLRSSGALPWRVALAAAAQAPIEFAGTLEEVLTVGASNQWDERKTLRSKDGEPWGSNYGPSLDLLAPGVQIATTDIRGHRGYSPDDFTLTFNTAILVILPEVRVEITSAHGPRLRPFVEKSPVGAAITQEDGDKVVLRPLSGRGADAITLVNAIYEVVHPRMAQARFLRIVPRPDRSTRAA